MNINSATAMSFPFLQEDKPPLALFRFTCSFSICTLLPLAKNRKTYNMQLYMQIHKEVVGTAEESGGFCDVLRVLRGLRSDPTLATRLLVELAAVHLLRPFNPLSASLQAFHKRCERDLESIQRTHRLSMRRAALGSVALHSLLLLSFYSFLYLTYGKFWF